MSRTKTYWFDEINRTDEVDDSDYLYFQWVSDLSWVDEDCIDVGKEILQKV